VTQIVNEKERMRLTEFVRKCEIDIEKGKEKQRRLRGTETFK
jgi:hypothetical protein